MQPGLRRRGSPAAGSLDPTSSALSYELGHPARGAVKVWPRSPIFYLPPVVLGPEIREPSAIRGVRVLRKLPRNAISVTLLTPPWHRELPPTQHPSP
ncbi:hypothetical protein AAFF_G00352740 [Aldrovandia affinis]|uniref:Uncharacterized protein n=1 Tax=Aldrovandia affinis TaxID=143900 RepID=A0AAD7SIY5_9TELE|nr:hypothetical protein AAFF_G00352740 [Aldrovandia affinis]